MTIVRGIVKELGCSSFPSHRELEELRASRRVENSSRAEMTGAIMWTSFEIEKIEKIEKIKKNQKKNETTRWGGELRARRMRKKVQTEQNETVGQGAIYGPPPNTEPLSAPCQPSVKVPKQQQQK